MELLPDDLLADVLRRLPARDLAGARCVHTTWLAAIIDSRRLMHLAPLPLIGIFINFNDHDFSGREVVRAARGGVGDRRLAYVQAPWPGDQQYAVYWRGHLYVHHNFILRISLSSGKYQAIKLPHGMDTGRFRDRRLGRSEKGVYLASIASLGLRRLQVWILDESCAHTKWVLKHQADLPHILAHRSYNPYARGSWVMEDVNYHFYSDGFPDYSGQAPPKDRFEWDSDNDDVLDTKDAIEGRYKEDINILGFHPHKEVLFLSESMRRGLAYHLNTSKLQDLGNMYPTRYDVLLISMHSYYSLFHTRRAGP